MTIATKQIRGSYAMLAKSVASVLAKNLELSNESAYEGDLKETVNNENDCQMGNHRTKYNVADNVHEKQC